MVLSDWAHAEGAGGAEGGRGGGGGGVDVIDEMGLQALKTIKYGACQNAVCMQASRDSAHSGTQIP